MEQVVKEIEEIQLWSQSSLLHQCIIWLAQQGIELPKQCNSPTQFCSALRDGLQLCSLLRKFDSTCLDDAHIISRERINNRPERRYFCCANLEIFLDACIANFNLSSDQLFEPSALYDCTNLDQVLHTLSALSCCPKVQLATGNRGFPFEPFDGDDDYQDFKKDYRVDEPETQAVVSDDKFPENQDIYVEFFRELDPNPRNPNGFEQTSAVHFVTSSAKQKPVISELIDTEKTFISMLKSIQDSIMKKFQPYFGNTEKEFLLVLENLITAHSAFYDNLTVSSSVVEILELFTMTWYDRMLVHGQYLFLLSTIQTFIDNLMESHKSLEDQLERDKEDFNFISLTNDLLLRPCQRILKYKLMIEKLQETTPPNQREEYATGQRAMEVVEDVSRYLNDVRKYQKDWENFKAATSRFSNGTEADSLQIETFGILLHEGELYTLRTGKKAPQLQYIFLFSRKMVACDIVRSAAKQKTERPLFHYKWDLDLIMVQLRDIKKASQVKTSLTSSNWAYKWELVLNSSSPSNEVIEIWAKTNKHKCKWISKFQQAFELLNPIEGKHSEHQLEIFFSQKPTKCDSCQTLLKGFYPQGYHCKMCEIILHKACLGLNRFCYTDKTLGQYPWYAGKMCRDVAECALRNTSIGTFLVRYKVMTVDNQEITSHAISYKREDETTVKHIMIKQESYTHPRNKYVYFLGEGNKFYFISQLVEWCLRESCGNLLLSIPWKRVVPTAIVTWDYSTDTQQPDTISLEKGQHVIILKKESAWWLGFSCRKTCQKTSRNSPQACSQEGYFPKNYVEEYIYSANNNSLKNFE